MIELKNKELNKLFKAYRAYKEAQAAYETMRDIMCKDLDVGKYISDVGTLNKYSGYSKVIDRVRFAEEHPEIDLASYEKITPYTSVKIKLNT